MLNEDLAEVQLRHPENPNVLRFIHVKLQQNVGRRSSEVSL